jgi:hypothetical protein
MERVYMRSSTSLTLIVIDCPWMSSWMSSCELTKLTRYIHRRFVIFRTFRIAFHQDRVVKHFYGIGCHFIPTTLYFGGIQEL